MSELCSLPKSTLKAISETEFLMKEGYDLLKDMEVVKQVIVLVKKHMDSMDTSLWDGFCVFSKSVPASFAIRSSSKMWRGNQLTTKEQNINLNMYTYLFLIKNKQLPKTEIFQAFQQVIQILNTHTPQKINKKSNSHQGSLLCKRWRTWRMTYREFREKFC